MWSLKNATNEFIYKTEIEPQTYKQTKGESRRWGNTLGVTVYTLLYIKRQSRRTYYIAQGAILNIL